MQKPPALFEKAQNLTLKHFGKTIQLYAPLYISNECINSCTYCGFNTKSGIKRVTLTVEQIIQEGKFLKKQGFQHILIVCGENKQKVPVSFLKEAIKKLKEDFVSISIEVYPMEEEEYRELIEAGADGLAIYQETYHPETYKKVHPKGPKSNYQWRYEAPERAARAGMRKLGLGVLLGLYDWRYEIEKLSEQLNYLMKKYWQTQFQLSFPRLNPAETDYEIKYPVSDEDLIAIITTLRINFPQLPFTLSTRENEKFRNQILPYGITSMSAGSKTFPGGYTLGLDSGKQFEIADNRTVKEVVTSIKKAGYEPVFKDWDRELI